MRASGKTPSQKETVRNSVLPLPQPRINFSALTFDPPVWSTKYGWTGNGVVHSNAPGWQLRSVKS
jgi:hypothetical protein